MDFHKQYRDMNENITPSDTLVQQTIAKWRAAGRTEHENRSRSSLRLRRHWPA